MDDFIDDFIEEYKNQPCLWQTQHPDFKNRKKRQEAYMKLIEVANQHNEVYNVERTKQKINNLRCAFRVQLKKFNEIKNSTKEGKEEMYCPKRKYFKSLLFLLNEETAAAKAEEAHKNKVIKRINSCDNSGTSKEQLGKKEVDKELNTIAVDVSDDIEDDEEILISQSEEDKEKLNKSISIDENDESFNLSPIEHEDENVSIDDKDIDAEVFETISEEDPKNDIQPEFIKVKKIRTSNSSSTLKETDGKKKQTPSPPSVVTKNNKQTDEKPITQGKNSIPNSTSKTSPTSTITTRANLRQIQQTKPIQQSNNSKSSPVSSGNNTNTKMITLRQINPNTPSGSIQVTKSTPPMINTIPQKRMSTNLTTQSTPTSSSTLTITGIPTQTTTSKSNLGSGVIAQKVVFSKASTPQQSHITIRNTPNHLQTRPTIIPSSITAINPQHNTNHDSSITDQIGPQTKKIRLDLESSNIEKIFNLACSKLKHEDNEDDFSIFGRMVTCKLNAMESDQALIAQKLINDILFDGQMKLLKMPQSKHQNFQKINIPSSLPHIISQSLQTTPVNSINTINASGQTYYISEINGENEANTVQFNSSNSSSEC